ncbi:hypothetical protein PanWU01x14_232430 [Parasponia andersonii]|uniref:Uncharacterized protein n=1 Tax=Parasponia andersonii TaxID=3476 RepID=A0A2P5BJY0_PARAD|nr:hypothetical protein PanWU01x14_232430 [Parasponia andersonii]
MSGSVHWGSTATTSPITPTPTPTPTGKQNTLQTHTLSLSPAIHIGELTLAGMNWLAIVVPETSGKKLRSIDFSMIKKS